MSRHTTAAAWVRGVADFLAAQGLDVHELCREAGIGTAWLGGTETRLHSDMLNALWEQAARTSGNEAIALSAPQLVHPAHFEVVGYAMMSCPNLLAGLQRLVRYTRVVSESASAELSETQQGWQLSFELQAGDRPVPRQRYEYIMLALLVFCRWVSGYELVPLKVQFAHDTPADPRAHAAAFGCALQFGAPMHGLLFAHDDLMRPLRTSNPLLAELHDRFADESLGALGSSSVGSRAREVMVRKLPEGEPRREDVASQLFMSERTLQRRLHDEGTSFQQLLDNTRKELTRQYLRQPRIALTETTYLLGFADQSNFHRACKRWFGVSPGQYRAQLDGRHTA